MISGRCHLEIEVREIRPCPPTLGQRSEHAAFEVQIHWLCQLLTGGAPTALIGMGRAGLLDEKQRVVRSGPRERLVRTQLRVVKEAGVEPPLQVL